MTDFSALVTLVPSVTYLGTYSVNEGINNIILSKNPIFTLSDYFIFNSSNTQITRYISNGNISDLIWNVTENRLRLKDLDQNYKFNIKLYFEFYSNQQTFLLSYIYYKYGKFEVKIKTNLGDPTTNIISPYINTTNIEIQLSKHINEFNLKRNTNY